MSDDNIKNHSSKASGNSNLDEPIQPIDFTPVGQTSKKFSFKLSPVKIILSAFLLLFASTAWFVLSAKSVYLDVTPATSLINVENPLAIKIGPRYLVLKGDLPVIVTAEGYYPLDTDLTVTDQQAQTFVIDTVPLPGFLGRSYPEEWRHKWRPGHHRVARKVGETPLTDLEARLQVIIIVMVHQSGSLRAALKLPFLWKGAKPDRAWIVKLLPAWAEGSV